MQPNNKSGAKPWDFKSYKAFKKTFPYQGNALYALLFKRHSDKIKLRKEKFAIRNLQKIFTSTFQLVPKIGFPTMSLRDLSAETGLSMGGLYSTISYKENIAIMVKDLVALVCHELVAQAKTQADPKIAMERMIRGYLYAATLLQPWFYFLYFETRSLPLTDQEESKNIERFTVSELSELIQQVGDEQFGIKEKTAEADILESQAEFIATMQLAMIQERYLKPWKYHNSEQSIDAYAQMCLLLINIPGLPSVR